MLSIRTNIPVLSANTNLARAGEAIGRSLKRLATGERLTSAGDDPAALVAGEGLKSRIRVVEKKIEGLQLSGSYLAAREGSQSVLSDLLTELEGLAVTAANRGAVSPEEREALQLQADSIVQTFDKLANTTTFKGQRILDGFLAARVGVTSVETTNPDGTTSSETFSLADFAAGGRLNLVSGDAARGQEVIKAARAQVSGSRAAIGAGLRDIDSQVSVLSTELENLSGAKSQLLDTDYAKETAELVRNQVLQDAALSVRQLAARVQAETVLELLRGV